jgi:aminoglycoside 2''-phosphotransferase
MSGPPPNPTYLARLRACYPDLPLDRVEVNAEGLVNDVLIVDSAHVFRFPKADWGRDLLRAEGRILDLVRVHVTLPVPAFTRLEDDFAACPLIPGVPLTRDDILCRPPAEQDRLLAQLAGFLRELHAIPAAEVEQQGIGRADAQRTTADWLALYEAVQAEVFPLLMAHQRAWVHRLFAPVVADPTRLDAYSPALIHGDLGPYHILHDPAQAHLTGVIDFGTAGLGDPAVDFALIINVYGESLLRRMHAHHPGIVPALDRARFLAGTLELQWTLHGVRSEDRSWFTVNLSLARDVLPFGSRWTNPSR